ncbi:aspartate--tRNA ligase [Fournierella massiliensis]|nr:aspartate--tRNA ligase [Fournierella massiliensis]MCF2557539.1 aspartate--tRNA ligase [Fournierella massiliensis]
MLKRTVYCGALREKDIGAQATACGWVQTKRDMGGIIFIDLRDREGVLQVVFDARNLSAEDFAAAEGLKNETVIGVAGLVRHRDEETYNPKLATGTVELMATKLEVISEADPLPFSLEDAGNVNEALRLKYRYLDLRRPEMFSRLKFRHQVQKCAEDYLDAHGFLSVETPILTKSTPEGARDYLVPSRVHHGSFYALPQSPQIFKQLLMVGGIDRYYQVARCFRDEDLRADRQPEFTQVDMEMSFVEQEDVLVHLEDMFKYMFRKLKGIDFKEPFRRMTWHEAMDVYGSDKPDLRFELPIVDVTEQARDSSFSVFKNALKAGGVVRAITVPGKADFTRNEIEALTQQALHLGAKGMAWIAWRSSGEVYSILTKYFTEEQMNALLAAAGAKPGDFVLFSADKLSTVRRVLGGLRTALADMLDLRRDEYNILFIIDFPQFEYSEEEGRWVATHHPFTMPYPEDLQYLFTDPGRVRAQAFDVVLNGVELGSGSVRIHQREVQKQMFEALGFDDEQIEARFGFMVNAYRYGAPPHAGFAFGLDRFVMELTGAESLRDVLAFPKLKDASCPLTDAPNVVDDIQLEELAICTADQLEKRAAQGGKGRSGSEGIDVEHVAKLAKLKITPAERETMRRELAQMVDFAGQLEKIDTTGVEPMAHIMPVFNVLRPDEPVPSFDRDLLLENTPAKEDGYIFVPQVVE